MLLSFIWQSEDWIIFDWFSGHGSTQDWFLITLPDKNKLPLNQLKVVFHKKKTLKHKYFRLSLLEELFHLS